MLPGKLYSSSLAFSTALALLLSVWMRLEPPAPATSAAFAAQSASVAQSDKPDETAPAVAQPDKLAKSTMSALIALWPSAHAAPPAFASLPPDSPAAVDTTAAAPQIEPNGAGAQIGDPPYKLYVTTAYFLNVREEAGKEARIVDVVPEGSELRIVAEAGNGWLKLHGGGYIHGDYAVPVSAPQAVANAWPPDGVAAGRAGEATGAPALAPPSASDAEKPGSKVKTPSGLTAEQIKRIVKGTALAEAKLEQAILDIEREYGINAFFTIAVMRLESGNGKSRLARLKNNLFGLNAIAGDAFDKALSFDTKQDSIRKFGELISANYVDKGLTTVEKIAGKYCPANEEWPTLVDRIMQGDYRKVQA